MRENPTRPTPHSPSAHAKMRTREAKWRRQKKSRRRRWIVWSVIVTVLLVVAIVLVSERGFNMFFAPDTGVFNRQEQIATPTFVGDNRKEGVYNILVIGHDRVAMNTDVLMICTFDGNNKTASIAQIPRDTYVDTVKVNSLYSIGYHEAVNNGADATEAEQKGIENLIDSLQKAFSITIDRYVMMDLDGFSSIVDLIGGVVIDIPYTLKYSDPAQDLYIDFEAGVQHLNGEQAEQFVRFREGYAEADLGRVNAQKLFLSAFFDKAKESLDISSAMDIAKEVSAYTETSMSVADMAYFIRYGLQLDAQKITTFTMPGIAARSRGNSGTWFYFTYRDDCIDLINQYMNVYTEPVTVEQYDLCHFLTNYESDTMMGYFTTPRGTWNVYALDTVDQEVSIPQA